MFRVADKCSEILDKNLAQIRSMLLLDYEVGGYLITVSGTMETTITGDPKHPVIHHMNLYPFHVDTGIVDWHTHHNSISPSGDGLHSNACRMIPSDTDILALIRASMIYEEPCVSIVISKKGYFFMTPDRLEYDIEMLQEELGILARNFFFDHMELPLEKRVDKYIEAMKDLGISCKMVYRKLEAPPSHCIIL